MWKYVTSALTGQYEQPPYPCAEPWKKLDDVSDVATAEKISEETYLACQAMMHDPKWSMLSYVDPDQAEGGDIKLFSRPAIGLFHFIKGSFSIRDTTVQKCMSVMHADNLPERQKFSAEIIGYEKIGRVNPNIHIEFLTYWAPPPVAGRDFCFLVTRKEVDGSTWIYGSSVDYKQCPKTAAYVRSSSMWCWQLTQVGEHVLLQYYNCFNPRGWAPRFIISWLKSSVANELRAARAVVNGKDFTVSKTELNDCGVSKEEIEAEIRNKDKEQDQHA